MPRKPKGSYTRHTTDWFIGRCAIGGVFFAAGVGNGAAVSLFNDATDGSNLHLYKLWVQNDAAGAYWVTRQTGALGGTTVTTYPVVSSGAALWGVISYAAVPQVIWSPGPFAMPAYIGADNEAGSQDIFAAPGPICVLVPGDSLTVYNPAPGAISEGYLGVTFYWAVLPDLG